MVAMGQEECESALRKGECNAEQFHQLANSGDVVFSKHRCAVRGAKLVEVRSFAFVLLDAGQAHSAAQICRPPRSAQ
jgi:hypothetical protein